ncbi:thiamine pyrophosphate-dependent enzyme [Rapidithrix thailandica]|uniref:Thiamine pyrophosphate-dependent enzyme n=1 Tax=Rapidithrix thailandica TaxID=413964 RepID=A0AAW9S6N0_9BACT
MYVEDLTKKSHFTKEEVLNDYRLVCESREASYIGRKEVFMGKAKFGIFGDGKEVAQIAMAKAFKNGDFRSGYYRDQTFMLAIGQLTLEAFFSQLYAHTDVQADPSSAGRCMNAHFATRSLNEDGSWKDLTQQKNSSPDVSSTAGQMPRLVGLGYASKLYRNNPRLAEIKGFSVNGNEIAFGTIGNAACAEGPFLEAINAAGVLQIPMLMSIWDDQYGISVPHEYQTTGKDLYHLLSGMHRSEESNGIELYQVNGWDYEKLCAVYQNAESLCREEHIPVVIHVNELTQPQGHSTSGSHERYKSKERLAWEKEYDCNKKFREWILSQELATEEEIREVESAAKKRTKEARENAWKAFVNSMKDEHSQAVSILSEISELAGNNQELKQIKTELEKTLNPIRLDAIKAIKIALRELRFEQNPVKEKARQWLKQVMAENRERYSSHLYSESAESALNVAEVKAEFNEQSKIVDGREVLNACFDQMISRDPRVFAIGEDVGKIGDVNQGFAGLQQKHGELHVTDTGIREATIIGQGIGAALRGLRPITEIQYIDYIFYAFMTMTDDLATIQYRTKGGQKAPMIIRTRGHRLEGIWHSGSPIGSILHCTRGIYMLVPRNMTKAAGFYNTMLQSDDTAIIIECLNGYRLKEKMPKNIAEITTPLGIPETIREGDDVTIVTYGSMCRIVMEAAEQLQQTGINCEVIDVQSLLPFDIDHKIVESIKKTNRVIFADEDVPGGTSAYMMQKVVDEQNAYRWLDSKPVCISAKEHRPAYASDGDYFSKPNPEDVFDTVYEMMHEVNPTQFPPLY